jgi:hypothetical protein
MQLCTCKAGELVRLAFRCRDESQSLMWTESHQWRHDVGLHHVARQLLLLTGQTEFQQNQTTVKQVTQPCQHVCYNLDCL